MTPPATLKVGPYVYTVELRTGMSGDNVGETDADAGRIRLNGSHPACMLRASLLHEVLHAVHHAAGVRDADAETTPEQFIRHIEAGLLAVFRDNPALVAYLLAD